MEGERVMKKFLAAVLILISVDGIAQFKSGEELISFLWKKYSGKTSRTITFRQSTRQYRNDSLYRTSTWFENFILPDKFRIDFDSFPSGGHVIFRSDSVYASSKGKIVRAAPDTNDLLLVLGGMYFRKLPDVIARLQSSGYKLQALRDTVFDGASCYVIGEPGSKQIFIGKKNLRVKGIISEENGRELNMVVKDWVKNGKGWMEQKLMFYEKGKLIQEEEYLEIKFGPVNAELFKPGSAIKK
jgi:hypothetical protein